MSFAQRVTSCPANMMLSTNPIVMDDMCEDFGGFTIDGTTVCTAQIIPVTDKEKLTVYLRDTNSSALRAIDVPMPTLLKYIKAYAGTDSEPTVRHQVSELAKNVIRKAFAAADIETTPKFVHAMFNTLVSESRSVIEEKGLAVA